MTLSALIRAYLEPFYDPQVTSVLTGPDGRARRHGTADSKEQNYRGGERGSVACVGCAALPGIPLAVDCNGRFQRRHLDVQRRLGLADDESQSEPARRIAGAGRQQPAALPLRVARWRACRRAR